MLTARRHPLLAALLGFWLLFAMVEPVSWHPCAMHDGMAMAGGHADATSMTMPMSAAAHDDDVTHAPAHAPASHACTCLSMGCCAAAAAVPPAADVGHWGVAVVDVRREVLAVALVRPTAADHVIPFANGPPAPPAA